MLICSGPIATLASWAIFIIIIIIVLLVYNFLQMHFKINIE